MFDNYVLNVMASGGITKYSTVQDIENIVQKHCKGDEKTYFYSLFSLDILKIAFSVNCDDLVTYFINKVDDRELVIHMSKLLLDNVWECKIVRKIYEIMPSIFNKNYNFPYGIDESGNFYFSSKKRYIELVLRNNPTKLGWVISNIPVEINYSIQNYCNLMGLLIRDIISRKKTFCEISYNLIKTLAPYFNLKRYLYENFTTESSLLKLMCKYRLHVNYIKLFFELCPDYEVNVDDMGTAILNFNEHVCNILHAKYAKNTTLFSNADNLNFLFWNARSTCALTWLLNNGYNSSQGNAILHICRDYDGDKFIDIVKERLDLAYLSEVIKNNCVLYATETDNIKILDYLINTLNFPVSCKTVKQAISSTYYNYDVIALLSNNFDYSMLTNKLDIYYYDIMYYLLIEKRVNIQFLTFHERYAADLNKAILVNLWIKTLKSSCPEELDYILRWMPGRHPVYPMATRCKIMNLLTIARAKSSNAFIKNISFDVLLHVFSWVACAP